MKNVLPVLLAGGLLLGCGGAEPASTDTAVTETVAPDAVTPEPAATETSQATDTATGAAETAETGRNEPK